ncbi:MAG: phage tail assembly chaperone [Proteobacteria bacterium]|nr:phage tail assembly chaperone [Pseudomonadota bacterium]
MTSRQGEALAWTELMRLGLGALRLAPEVFWAMTPVELQRALEGAGILAVGGAGSWMERAALEGLMARFPDQDKGSKA